MQIFSSHRPTWLQALAFQNTSCGCRFLAALTCSLKPIQLIRGNDRLFRHLEGYRRINDANRIVPSTTELPAFAADRSNLETLNGVDRSISRKFLLVLHGCGCIFVAETRNPTFIVVQEPFAVSHIHIATARSSVRLNGKNHGIT